MNRRSFLGVLAAVAVAPLVAQMPVSSTPVQTGWVTSGLKAGDIITISGCYVTNPKGSRDLQEFTITSAYNA